MKFIIIIAMLLSSLLGKAQSDFPEGTYVSGLGDIIIRNDSVISKDVSYYVFYYRSSVNSISETTTVSYTSEDKKQVLTVVYTNGLPRYLTFVYEKNYNIFYYDSFNVAFIPGE